MCKKVKWTEKFTFSWLYIWIKAWKAMSFEHCDVHEKWCIYIVNSGKCSPFNQEHSSHLSFLYSKSCRASKWSKEHSGWIFSLKNKCSCPIFWHFERYFESHSSVTPQQATGKRTFTAQKIQIEKNIFEAINTIIVINLWCIFNFICNEVLSCENLFK